MEVVTRPRSWVVSSGGDCSRPQRRRRRLGPGYEGRRQLLGCSGSGGGVCNGGDGRLKVRSRPWPQRRRRRGAAAVVATWRRERGGGGCSRQPGDLDARPLAAEAVVAVRRRGGGGSTNPRMWRLTAAARREAAVVAGRQGGSPSPQMWRLMAAARREATVVAGHQGGSRRWRRAVRGLPVTWR